MSRRTYGCPECHRRFGGVSAYDRHVDRRRDRCRSDRDLHRIGISPGEDGVYDRRPPAAQTTLVDLRRIPRMARQTRREKALALAEACGVPKGEGADAEAPGRCGGHCWDAETPICHCSCGGRYHGIGRRAREIEAAERGQLLLGAAS